MIAKRVGGAKPRLTPGELRDALEAHATIRRPDPRTLLSLVHQWRRSPEWNALAASTRRTWESQLSAIEAKWGRTPLSLWNDPRMKGKVVQWRNSREHTPRGADLGVLVLRELLKFGNLNARVLINVAAQIPCLYRGGQRAEIVWTDDDIDRFQWQALKDDQAHLIDGVWLAALTGLRRADLVTVSQTDIYDRAIVKKALKVSRRKRRTATLPRIPELDLLLDELASRRREEGVKTLLVNSRGRPWTGDGFGGSFNRIRDAAEIFHVDQESGSRKRKHLHDLRGTFATRLITAGLSDIEVAEVMGWAVDDVSTIRRTYVDQSHVVVAIGERIAQSSVNRPVN